MTTYTLYEEDCLTGLASIANGTVDLVVADPPYRLGKDYGNNSDKLNEEKFLAWTKAWILAVIPKMKETGSLYIFATWRHAPEIFSFLKQKMVMKNEIIWDRCVPSMGGSTRNFSSVHDNIGFFVKNEKKYFFDLDPVRQAYDAETKKKRTRSIFVGKKWLELGCNPKDIWRISRLHRLHREREDHPTQKPMELIERMILASCPLGGMVLDPFAGSGTTLDAALSHKRHASGFEINQEYCKIIRQRMARHTLPKTKPEPEPKSELKSEQLPEQRSP